MTKEIIIRHKYQRFTALVDDEDYPDLKRFRWHLSNNGYVYRSVGFTDEDSGRVSMKISMHRHIVFEKLWRAKKTEEIDHINGNKLDNRRCNLRIVSRSQNAQNKGPRKDSPTGFKGVTIQGKKFLSQIHSEKKNYRLGLFDSAENAARAYDAKALELFGEYAWLNFREAK